MSDNSFFEDVSCRLCSAGQAQVIYPSSRDEFTVINLDTFRSSGDEPLKEQLVKCKRCGLEYITPRLKEDLVMKGYADSIDERFLSQVKGREKTFENSLKIIERIWEKPPGEILDIGTANGSFLKVAKDAGWKVTGCEPNSWMCNWCKKNYGIEITPGTIFDVNCDSESYDIITLWDVLEHTPDPIAVLNECARIIRPGGLVVITYPDIGSWIAKLMGRRWVFLLSVHYYYFTKKTIKTALKKVGLENILLMKPYFQSLGLEYVLFRAIPYIGRIGRISRLLVEKLNMANTQIPYWMGQTLVIAKKSKI